MSFGTLAVDFELRVDFPRLRKERLEKAKEALKDSGLGALVCFDPDNIRYITSATIGAWSLEHPEPIKENMVFALETFSGPKGGKHGIRIEDEIVVTSTGPRVITTFPSEELIACPI